MQFSARFGVDKKVPIGQAAHVTLAEKVSLRKYPELQIVQLLTEIEPYDGVEKDKGHAVQLIAPLTVLKNPGWQVLQEEELFPANCPGGHKIQDDTEVPP